MSIHTLRKRFVRDENLPIQVLQDPYFDYFLNLYNPLFGSMTAYSRFLSEVEKAGGEDAFLQQYNHIKDGIIATTQQNESYQHFSQDPLKEYHVTSTVTKEDIYQPKNDGKQFISIDLKKANFHALRYYNPAIVDHQSTYESWIAQYTDSLYMQKSKYIRQVIFGNLNPKKQVKLEKYIIQMYLEALLKELVPDQIKNASHDEIVVEVQREEDYAYVKQQVSAIQTKLDVPARTDLFTLRAQPSPKQLGYVKEYLNREGVEFKGVPALFFPQAFKHYFNLPLQEEDFVFYHEGYLATLREPVLSQG